MEAIPICDRCLTASLCVARFRALAEARGLQVTLDVSLSGMPESVHLHLRKRGEKAGTLEYTLSPRDRRCWLSFHANRSKPWIADEIAGLVENACPNGPRPPEDDETGTSGIFRSDVEPFSWSTI